MSESSMATQIAAKTFADALATQTKDVLAAVERRLRDHRIDQAVNRREHLDIITGLLNEHRSDVLADVAKLMQSNGAAK